MSVKVYGPFDLGYDMKNTSNPNYSAHIVVLSGVEKHPNADRLQKAKAFGSGIVVGLDAKDGDIGVYFQSGLALDSKFAVANDLIRRKNPVTNAPEGGMLDANCRIRTQKFRGEISDGLFLPMDSLRKAGVEPWLIDDLHPGDFFENIAGTPICTKYVIKTRNTGGASSKLPKVKGSVMFKEHYDTPQLRFNLENISRKDYIVITEKVHGTSQRLGNVQDIKPLTGAKKFVAKLFGLGPIMKWRDIVGTRRTVVQIDNQGGFYSKDFRFEASQPFFGKLYKGETIYYEVIGYADERPIMGTVDNEKLGPEFVKAYGKKTTFSYGCEPGKFAIYVYRITLTNEDGYSMDYTWEAIEKRCDELSVPFVPVLFKGPVSDLTGAEQYEDTSKLIEDLAELYVQGPSTIDSTHIKEGVVIRVEGTSCPKTYKHKSFEFKVLEGIIKPETASIQDTEEL